MKNTLLSVVHNPLNCPCRDCEERNAECHSICSLCKDWRSILSKKNEGVRKLWNSR